MYEGQWIWDGTHNNGADTPMGQLYYEGEVLAAVDDLLPVQVVVNIKTSEPMNEVSFTLNGEGDNYNTMNVDDTFMEWIYTFNMDELESLGGDQRLHITAKDLADNDLTGFDDPADEEAYIAPDLPHRTGENTWSTNFTATTDQAHFFHIPECVVGDGLQASENCFLTAAYDAQMGCTNTPFIPSEQSVCVGASIQLFDVSCASCADDTAWDFGGATATLTEDPDLPYYELSWSEAGTYTVTLSLSGSNAYNTESIFTQTFTVNNSTDCLADGQQMLSDISTDIVNACNDETGAIAITFNSLDNTDGFTFQWLNSDGNEVGSNQNNFRITQN